MATAAEIFALPELNSIDLEEITIDRLQYHLEAGSFTSRELTLFCIARIQQVFDFI